MKWLLLIITIFFVSNETYAQTKKGDSYILRLKCSGLVQTKSTLNPSKNSNDKKTFLLTIKVENGKPSFETNDLPLWATQSSIARVNQPKGLVQKISDEQITIAAEFTFIEPLKGGGMSSLVLNRYTGTAKQFEMLMFANERNEDLMSVDAEYNCISVDKKLF